MTDELATTLNLPSSGLTNQELTTRTEELVDRLLEAADDDSLWDYFPGLTGVSLGIVIWALWQRHRQGDITFAKFRWLAARATGLKATKVALLTLALSVPGLNVVTGAALVVSLIYSGARMIKEAGSLGQGEALPRRSSLPGPGQPTPRPDTPAP